jgi:hypothetical protein
VAQGTPKKLQQQATYVHMVHAVAAVQAVLLSVRLRILLLLLPLLLLAFGSQGPCLSCSQQDVLYKPNLFMLVSCVACLLACMLLPAL